MFKFNLSLCKLIVITIIFVLFVFTFVHLSYDIYKDQGNSAHTLIKTQFLSSKNNGQYIIKVCNFMT